MKIEALGNPYSSNTKPTQGQASSVRNATTPKSNIIAPLPPKVFTSQQPVPIQPAKTVKKTTVPVSPVSPVKKGNFISPAIGSAIEAATGRPGAVKFAATTGVALADLVSEGADFTADFLVSQISGLIKKPVIGVAGIGPVSNQQKVLADKWKSFYQEQLTKKNVPTQNLKEFVDKLQQSEYIRPSDEWTKASLKEKLTKRFGETLFNLGPSIISSMGVYVYPPAGLAIITTSTANNIKDDAIRYGVPEDKAETIALASGMLIGALDHVVPNSIFSRLQKQAFMPGLIKRVVGSAITEAGTEIAQENIQIAVEKTFRDDLGWDEVKTRNALAGLGGFLGGAGMDIVVSFANNIRTGEIGGIEADEKGVSKELLEKIRTKQKMTPEDRKEIISSGLSIEQINDIAEGFAPSERLAEDTKILRGEQKYTDVYDETGGFKKLLTKPEPGIIAPLPVRVDLQEARPLTTDDDILKAVAENEEKITSSQEELKNTLQKNREPVERAISEIVAEMEIAEAGQKLFLDNGEVSGYSSTFPSWVPEEFRSKELFNEVLTPLVEALETGKYPDTNKVKQREFFDYLLDQVDSRAGIDTALLRNSIMSSYEPYKVKTAIPGRAGRSEQKSVSKEKPSVSTKPSSKGQRGSSKTAANVDRFANLPVLTEKLKKDATSIPFPEMVTLARELLNKYPTVHKNTGEAKGLFITTKGGEIRLNAAIFSDVTQAAKTLAHEIGHLVDYLPGRIMKRGNLLGRLASLTEYRKVFLPDAPGGEFKPVTEKDKRELHRFAREFAKQPIQAGEEIVIGEKRITVDEILAIWRDANIAENDPDLLAYIQTLSNEQKVEITRKAMAGKVPGWVTFKRKITKTVTRETFASAPEDIRRIFKDLLEKEIRRRRLLSLAIIREESMDLSMKWKGTFEKKGGTDYDKYRRSSKELYADMISVLFNDPRRLQIEAPMFWDGFINYIDSKPEVKDSVFTIWDLLHEPEDVVLNRRLNQIYKGYGEAKEKRKSILTAQKPVPSLWARIMSQHVTRFDPIYRKMKGISPDYGILTSPTQKLRMQMEEMQMRRNEAYLYVDTVKNEISKPLSDIGLTEDDLGVLLQLERNLGDRKDIANPYGLQGQYSKETLDHFKTYLQKNKSITDEQFVVLTQIAKRFRDITFSKVEDAVETEVYSREFFEKTAKPNKDTYATYQVIEYIHDNYVSAGIKQAVGTLKSVENPVISTMLKTIAVVEAVELQRGKLAVIDQMKQTFPGDISDSVPVKPKGVRVGWKPIKDRIALEYYVDGKRAAVDVDPYIARMFEFYTPTEIHNLVKASGAFNRVFKPVVTTYNLSWGFYANIIRDSKRTYKNLGSIVPTVGNRKGLSIIEYIHTWISSIPQSAKFQKNELTPLVKEALKNKALSIPFVSFDTTANEADWLKPIVRRYSPLAGDIKQVSLKKKLLVPVSKILKAIEFAGSTFETTTKVAGYQIAKRRDISAREAGFITRNYVGTPNYMEGGTQKQVDNNVFVFSNIMIQAIRTDIEIATNPQTRSGYWYRTFVIDILPKLLMLAGVAGYFGKLVKEIFDKASEYDKTNYIVVPMGVRENGKANYLRIPQDETGRLFSAIVWKIGSYLNGDLKKPEQIAELGAGYIPSMTPIWEVGGGWMNLIQGRNPYDSYRGRLVIDDTTFKAGGLPVFTKMLQWTSNELGLSQFTTYTDETDTTFDLFMKYTPILNRAFKSTDYGLKEKEQVIRKQLDQDAARRILKEREVLQEYIDNARKRPDLQQKLEHELIEEVIGPIEDSDDKRRRTNLLKKYKIGILRGTVSRELDSLIEANTNDYKIELLKLYKESLPENEYTDLKSTAIKNKIIGDEVIREMKKFDKDAGKPQARSTTRQVMTDIFAHAKDIVIPEAFAAEADTLYPGRVYLNETNKKQESVPVKEETLFKKFGKTLSEAIKKLKPQEIIKAVPDDYKPEYVKKLREVIEKVDPESKVLSAQTKRVPENVEKRVEQGDIGVYIAEHFPESELANVPGVLDGENGARNPIAKNTNKNGSIDRGIFQINSNTFADFKRRKGKELEKYGISTYDDMYDPEKNIIMASIIFKEQGWCGWYGAPAELRKNCT